MFFSDLVNGDVSKKECSKALFCTVKGNGLGTPGHPYFEASRSRYRSSHVIGTFHPIFRSHVRVYLSLFCSSQQIKGQNPTNKVYNFFHKETRNLPQHTHTHSSQGNFLTRTCLICSKPYRVQVKFFVNSQTNSLTQPDFFTCFGDKTN